jgi:hypothetical protein
VGRRGISHFDRLPSSLPGCPEEKGQNPVGGPRNLYPSDFEFMLLLPPSLRREPCRLPPLRTELKDVTSRILPLADTEPPTPLPSQTEMKYELPLMQVVVIILPNSLEISSPSHLPGF